MQITPTDHILPLRIADRHTLQVLVQEFQLAALPSGGRRLTLRLLPDQLAFWNREGRRQVSDAVLSSPRELEEAARMLQTAWSSSSSDQSVRYPIPFRYVSGGALPVVRFENHDYYCLFYREIFPVGWNIANGGSDNRHELLRPFDIVDRELREELVIFNPEQGRRYVFHGDADKPSDWPEFAVARRVIQRSVERQGRSIDFSHMAVATLAYKWIDGPDLLVIEVPGRSPVRLQACHLNVNAEDFGIEIDRVVRFRIEPGDMMIDAETLETGPLDEAAVVNAPIGLFEVRRMHHELNVSQAFVPDMFFHDGVLYRNGADLDDFVRTVFSRDIFTHLSDSQRAEYERAPLKYDPCPVTRRIIGRYRGDLEGRVRAPERAQTDGAYDVFVSFAGEDKQYAADLVDGLGRLGRRAFFSAREITAGWWSEPIDRAIESDSCEEMLVIATSRDHVLKPAVTYEYRAFHQMIMTGRKPKNGLKCLIHGFSETDLPLPLAAYQASTFEPAAVAAVLERLQL